MDFNEILIILRWWFILLVLGFSFLPLTFKVFSNFRDGGYIFSKIIGLGALSYAIFLLGTFHILPFSTQSIVLILITLLLANLIFIKNWRSKLKKASRIIIFEEIVFLAALLFWSYIRGTNPDIQGLEKFMDFGFINSILRSSYFPPKDIWFTPFSINYYYFGHLTIAVLTHLSAIKSSIAFNLSVASMFAFTFAGSFSIGANLIRLMRGERVARPEGVPSSDRRELATEDSGRETKGATGPAMVGGIVTAIFVSLGGNLQTIYAFFLPYSGENAPPFWQLIFSSLTFPNSYWYPNATRFIYRTIHEFPSYSFVVSDLHAHVLSLPFVLLTIALLLSILLEQRLRIISFKLLVLSLSLAILYMTNTWDVATYFLLAALVIFYIQWKNNALSSTAIYLLLIAVSTFVFILPFSIHFKPFTSGVGVICAPQFLQNVGKLGPFIFETNHCERSALWQLLILYGFFFFWILAFVLFIKEKGAKILRGADVFVILLIILSITLIIIPEFVYIKDIYSGHYRANTMFKFVYQAFIMLQISSAYIILRILSKAKEDKALRLGTLAIIVLGTLLSTLVFLYPVFAVNSYYSGAKNYSGLDGKKYLENFYPDDYAAINWLGENIKGQPVILEAQGDSYSNFARISSNTGLPTVIGWTVHEWLWRGSYDLVSPRVSDVKSIYETQSKETASKLLKKYDVSYVYVGDMERQKYQNLNEEKFGQLGKVVFQSSNTKIYKIN